MRLKVSKYQDSNDLSEVGKFLETDAFTSVATSNFIKEQCGYISFSHDYLWYKKQKKYPMTGETIPTMWAYYANSNRGVCLVIDEKKFTAINDKWLINSWLRNIKYKRLVCKDKFDTKNMSPEEIILKYHDKIFFYKQKSWSHEHERRLCIVNPPEFLSIKDCVVRIILGSRFEKNNMLTLASMMEDSNFECCHQFNRNNVYLQSNLDGISSNINNPFFKLEIEK